MHLAYRKRPMPLRNVCPWNRKQPVWQNRWMNPQSTGAGYRNRNWNSVSRKHTPWVSLQRSASPVLSVQKRFSDWQFTPAHDGIAAPSKTEEWMGSKWKQGPILVFINYLRVLNVLTQKIFKTLIKIHLQAEKALHNTTSIQGWIQNH